MDRTANQADPGQNGPRFAPEEVQRLVGELQAAGGALTAGLLALRMFSNDTEGHRRRVRAIASAARPRVVSFPGSNGYDLWDRCSEADIRHGIAAIRTQATAMLRDAALYQAAFEVRFRPVQTELALRP